MSEYAIGIDFGTLSARAVIVSLETGENAGSAVMDYPHGVLNECLPDGTPLKRDWALQHPGDYLECLRRIVPEAMAAAQLEPEDIVGLGIDCTSCSCLPVNRDNIPLCLTPEFADSPHAWVMLWKHHAAQPYATRMTDIARQRGERFLDRYGGKVSSEWLFPRLWQVLEEAPEVWTAAERFVDAGDWIVSRLTGRYRPSACIAGFKAFRDPRSGYPSADYLSALNPELARSAVKKLGREFCPLGSKAGVLTEEAARMLGLRPGIAVAPAGIDAHTAVPAAGLTLPGDMLCILGTSGCHMLLGDGERPVPGICGAVMDGFVPGLTGYEAGQSCLGDHFAWFTNRCVPAEYTREAERRKTDIHVLLQDLASRRRPGESGLIALDWWNGNRSVLVDADLTGLILGLTLATRPEDIYRALIEATAFGARTIADNFEAHGLPVRRVFACGGVAMKNPLLMQIYADVLNREIRVAASDQTCALGAAIFGALAAGAFDSLPEAVGRMTGPAERIYRPTEESVQIYERLYREYARLHDLFGRGGSDVMKRLKAIRNAD